MYFAVTIDTEEDNWGEYALDSYSLGNIARIPRLQDLFERHGVKPTYLVSYPVATDPRAIDVLGGYRANGLCEIGTHVHPWNTPPVEEDRTPFNSYISHLPAELQYRKIRTLTDTIEAKFGCRPTSYRSGRWGFDDSVALNLLKLGYKVDTSISPTLTWASYEGPDFSNNSHEPFVYGVGEHAGSERMLLEVPATVDYIQSPRSLVKFISTSIRALPYGPNVAAILERLGVLNHVSMSPETDDSDAMIRLAKVLIARGTQIINMFFHSPTLMEGLTPFVKNRSDAEAFFGRIDAMLTFARSAGLESITMSDLTAEHVGAKSIRWLPSREVVHGAGV